MNSLETFGSQVPRHACTVWVTDQLIAPCEPDEVLSVTVQVQVDPLLGHCEVTLDKLLGLATNFSGTCVGVGVAVGGLGVAVGGMGVAVGGINVAVGGMGATADLAAVVGVTVAIGVDVGAVVGLMTMVRVGIVVPDVTDDAIVFAE